MAEDFEALGFALAWVQSEDHGDVVARGLVRARGQYARFVGLDSIEGDFAAHDRHARAVETFPLLEEATRQVYDGFASGLNHNVRLHPDRFPEWMPTDFVGEDVHALDVQTWSRAEARSFVRSLNGNEGALEPPPASPDVSFALDGSNAWAFHPSRTISDQAILLRNPHLSWSAGYYEAHARVPGELDFYGDFRIGGPFGIIGGFNRHLGWATTNNYPRHSQIYALEHEGERPYHYRLDGTAHPLELRTTTVEYLTDSGALASETRGTWWAPQGPVIHRTEDRIYLLKDPRDGEFRRGEQFLRMMRTSSFEQWIGVMRMRAHPFSNFTYADAAGNIAHLYNARIPRLPHEVTGDTAAFASSTAQVWTELVPFDELPLYLNPPGGYVQQANDTPDYTNLNVPLGRDTMPHNLPEPRLRLRSQLSLHLVDGDREVSLEDVVRMKHTSRMLLAEVLTDDLIEAVRDTGPSGAVAEALDVLEAWDRTAAADSRGGVLFTRWVQRYAETADTAAFYEDPWSPERPMETPRGLGSPAEAADAFAWTAGWFAGREIPADIAWGEIHRVIRGDVDEPASGCQATLGCFRVLSFEQLPDGRRAANRGDGWVLAVEFGEVPRAYTVLAYGQSTHVDSPHHADQAAMFARGEMKAVAFTDEDIERTLVRRYRPGSDGQR
jgi:acyl-homoserine-lactone acylase